VWKAAIRLSGFVGLVIAVPLAAAIGVIVRFVIREYHLLPPELVNEPAPAARGASTAQELAEGTLEVIGV
jgi:hypothetical protein